MRVDRLEYMMSKQVNQFRDWAEDAWYESPLEISVWFASEDYAEVFFKLEKSVLVAKLTMIDESWESEKHLHIPLDIWKPGSIQVHTTTEGVTRFRHRQQEINLRGKTRAPEWAQTLLENWLLNLKNKRDNPRDRLQKLSSLKRVKATIERNLASASLSGVSTDIAIAGMKIDSAEKLLTPKSYAKDKQ